MASEIFDKLQQDLMKRPRSWAKIVISALVLIMESASASDAVLDQSENIHYADNKKNANTEAYTINRSSIPQISCNYRFIKDIAICGNNMKKQKKNSILIRNLCKDKPQQSTTNIILEIETKDFSSNELINHFVGKCKGFKWLETVLTNYTADNKKNIIDYFKKTVETESTKRDGLSKQVDFVRFFINKIVVLICKDGFIDKNGIFANVSEQKVFSKENCNKMELDGSIPYLIRLKSYRPNIAQIINKLTKIFKNEQEPTMNQQEPNEFSGYEEIQQTNKILVEILNNMQSELVNIDLLNMKIDQQKIKIEDDILQLITTVANSLKKKDLNSQQESEIFQKIELIRSIMLINRVETYMDIYPSASIEKISEIMIKDIFDIFSDIFETVSGVHGRLIYPKAIFAKMVRRFLRAAIPIQILFYKLLNTIRLNKTLRKHKVDTILNGLDHFDNGSFSGLVGNIRSISAEKPAQFNSNTRSSYTIREKSLTLEIIQRICTDYKELSIISNFITCLCKNNELWNNPILLQCNASEKDTVNAFIIYRNEKTNTLCKKDIVATTNSLIAFSTAKTSDDIEAIEGNPSKEITIKNIYKLYTEKELEKTQTITNLNCIKCKTLEHMESEDGFLEDSDDSTDSDVVDYSNVDYSTIDEDSSDDKRNSFYQKMDIFDYI